MFFLNHNWILCCGDISVQNWPVFTRHLSCYQVTASSDQSDHFQGCSKWCQTLCLLLHPFLYGVVITWLADKLHGANSANYGSLVRDSCGRPQAATLTAFEFLSHGFFSISEWIYTKLRIKIKDRPRYMPFKSEYKGRYIKGWKES